MPTNTFKKKQLKLFRKHRHWDFSTDKMNSQIYTLWKNYPHSISIMLFLNFENFQLWNKIWRTNGVQMKTSILQFYCFSMKKMEYIWIKLFQISIYKFQFARNHENFVLYIRKNYNLHGHTVFLTIVSPFNSKTSNLFYTKQLLA